MEIFLDESGSFRPSHSKQTQPAAVMGLLIPEIQADTLRADFDRFRTTLPKSVFVKGEPKGHRLSPEHVKQFASMLNRHRGITLAPVTVNTNFIQPSFFRTFPQKLRAVLEVEGSKCLYDSLKSEVAQLARQCGNLSPEQLVRLLAYTVAVKRSIEALSIYYHCKRYHESYSPLRVVLDRAGPPNGREELVFKQMLFMWMTRMTERTPITRIERIHNDSHPLVRLYGAKRNGSVGFNLSKMLQGNIEFGNSQTTWQLQIADMAAAAWGKALADPHNRRGYMPAFSLFFRNTMLPADQPVDMISIAETYSQTQTLAPPEFGIFLRLAQQEGKLLPCDWDEE